MNELEFGIMIFEVKEKSLNRFNNMFRVDNEGINERNGPRIDSFFPDEMYLRQCKDLEDVSVINFPINEETSITGKTVESLISYEVKVYDSMTLKAVRTDR